MDKRLQKYLRTRAVQAPWQLSDNQHSDYQAAIVIPALAESESLPKTLASLATNPSIYLQQALVIIVVNNRRSATDNEKDDNLQTFDWLQNNPFPQLNLVWIDASSAGLELPEKDGVGLARKIGFDLALSCLDWRNQPLLISLDADTLVDDQYLSAIFQHFAASHCGAATIPFRHRPELLAEHEAAIRQYELYLRSYLFGLQQAGSPYAYHTIGSALACRADAYLAAGGMNRRTAAEDFYFLQQLAKTSGVEMLSGTLVQPSARYSERVPFGTGKVVRAQAETGQMPVQFISAEAFSTLRDWLQIATSSLVLPAGKVLAAASALAPQLEQFLGELKFSQLWPELQKNYPGQRQHRAAFHAWFDGLRSRQLLSRLDADGQPPFAEKVADLLKWGGYPDIRDWREQLRLLERLQSVAE